MKKSEIMRMTNNFIEVLACCDDGEFVDDIIGAVSSACPFADDEIAEQEEKE